MAQKHLFRDRAPKPESQKLQHLELFFCENDWLLANTGTLCFDIDDEIATSLNGLGSCGRAAHDSVDTSDQLVFVERLCEVIVSPESEPSHLILDAGESRQDQDRGFYSPAPKRAQHVVAGH